VDDGGTGIVVPDGDVDAAAAAVPRAAALDRARVRETCERRFDAPRIVDDYERLYFEVLG
jgi:glycosyltransferase involved in cell wall biosynthesis